MNQPRSGYTLPVFACAAAMAALQCLRQESHPTVSVDLIEPPQIVAIPIEQVAPISPNVALAITRSDPGDNLDLTRHTPVWALVELFSALPELDTPPAITLKGGEGVGRLIADGGAAIYRYAQRLLRENLQRHLQPGEKMAVTIILPEGRRLAQRTSNAAFGVVEGLSLLGTSGIAQPLSAPGQLAAYREELAAKAQHNCLVFCVGENGLELAQRFGIKPQQLVKTANWLGPLLVAAGGLDVAEILLFGYHGKLIKLAGGIFHTHHHLADGRLEVLTAHCANLGLPPPVLKQVFASATTEAALQRLRQLDRETNRTWVAQVYGAIAATIDRRTQDYIRKHAERDVSIGSVLFDRNRTVIVSSANGTTMLSKLC
ncbi:MAG: cobalt-precorrin-5B (C(1))-methyltransferase CbiD [Cyanophyceae cyanobacterium]